MLTYTETFAYLENSGFFDAVELADALDGGAVFAGDAVEGIAAADRMVTHGGSLCGGTGGGFLLGLFFGQQTVFLVGAENLVLVVYVLDIPLVGIEVPGADFQEPVTQSAGFKVNEPGGIKGGTAVARLEMQVRTGGTAGGAAQADDVSGVHPVPGLHISLGKVTVEGLQAVGVADDHQVAVSAHVI